MLTSEFDYDLPPDRIAQRPAQPRDSSRLLVLDRETDEVTHLRFSDLPDLLMEGDLLIRNTTKVFPARLLGRKHPTGGRVELLLLNQLEPGRWETMVGGKGLTTGKQIEISSEVTGEVLEVLDGPRRIIQFNRPISPLLPRLGQVPLPPYITTPIKDPAEYQTVYAETPGSAAAPTAGFHFTESLISKLTANGIRFADVDLHIGLDTFAPVTEDNPEDHRIHTEWCRVPGKTVEAIHDARRYGSRIVAVGTTTVRALETAASQRTTNDIEAYEGTTDLYILPGFGFRIIQSMITNFHLPRSTLLMMVSAFAGRDRILKLYREAIQEGYRFYSFGDAMLIL